MDATEEHSTMRKMILGVIYVTGRDILRKNAGPPAGYAMRLDIRTKTVQRKNKKEEEVKAVEEEETNPILDREASQRREETHHIQRKGMVKNQTGITEQGMTVQTSLDLQTWTDLVDQDLILVQKKEKILLHEEKNPKGNQTKADTMEISELFPHTVIEELGAELTLPLPFISRLLGRQVIKSLRTRGWRQQ